MEDSFDGGSFITGVVCNAERAYLLLTYDDLVDEDVPHTRIFSFYQGNWGAMELDWYARSSAVCHLPDEKFIAIGDDGRVQLISGTLTTTETIGDIKNSPKRRGPLIEVRCIAGGRAYAVGTKRQVYRRDGPDVWSCIDKTAQTKATKMTDKAFHSIDGFTEEDIYAVGWDGEIWHFDGIKWLQMDSPTNLSLYKVRCCGDGFVYACGQVGTILKGKDGKWQSLDNELTDDDFWGMEWFQGKLYLATTSLVYVMTHEGLEPVDFGGVTPGTCSHLSAVGEMMWSIGSKDVLKFDGEDWTIISQSRD